MQLSAFVDDWTIACTGLLQFFSLRPIIRAFEIASGQEINEPKIGIIPSRQLSRAETLCCLVHWRNIHILYRTRILGLIIGLHATIEDQSSSALDKFAQALLELRIPSGSDTPAHVFCYAHRCDQRFSLQPLLLCQSVLLHAYQDFAEY